MRRAVFAALALVLTSSGAHAYCLSMPDTAATHYVDNSTAHALCLQQELSDTTERLAREAQWQAELGALAAQQQMRRRFQLQRLDPFPSL